MDLGTQLPLYMFLTVNKLLYNIPEIEEYLNDPIKRLIPIKHLPLHLRLPLLNRKYVMLFHTCYMINNNLRIGLL